jgi:hypothetical protein
MKPHTIPTQIKGTLHAETTIEYAQIAEQFSYAPTNSEQQPHINQHHQRKRDTDHFKICVERPVCTNGNYAKPHKRAP